MYFAIQVSAPFGIEMSDSAQFRRGGRAHGSAAIMIVLSLAVLQATPAWSQEGRDSIPSDVRVGIVYQPGFRPGIVVPAVAAEIGVEPVADSVRVMIRRDLDFSDRLQVMAVGEDLPLETPINYGLWDELGAVWLLVGAVEGTPDAPILRLSLHDVVFKSLQQVRAFELPPLRDRRFRLAVHQASDQVVRWATGGVGIAATRIAFVEEMSYGSEIWTVDSDGFVMRRLTGDGSIALSPAWSPAGDRIVYMSYLGGEPGIREYDLSTDQSTLKVDRPGLDMTPTYSPDGTQLAFASTIEGRTELYTFDLLENCCPQRMTFARFSNSLSPTFSPDGRRVAFNSDRLGQLHIFVKVVGDNNAELLTPYIYDRSVHNAGPDWSPTGDRIAFHGRVDGEPQIFTVAPNGSGLRQLTQAGRNEDPSWAPDGRHIVFASTRSGGTGLWVLDVVSGRIRRLIPGRNVRLPDWSGRLDSQFHSSEGEVADSNGQNP